MTTRKLFFNVDTENICNVYKLENMLEVTTNSKIGTKSASLIRYKRVDANSYVDKMTGEIKPYKKVTTRSMESLKKTLKSFERLVNANFGVDTNALHCVLTVGYIINNPSELLDDYKEFIRLLKKGYPDLIYVCIFEPHEKKSWHIHLLLKFPDNRNIFIPIGFLQECWNIGNVHISKFIKVNGFGGYFSCVLKDEKLTKKYPPNVKIYFYSRNGIVVPKPVKMTREQLDTLIKSNDYRLSYSKAIGVFDEEYSNTVPVNKILYEKYKKVNKK